MVNGANNHGQGKATCSSLKESAIVSYVSHTPRTIGYSSMARRQSDSKAQEVSYERTSRIKNENKSGCYERYTTKEKVSSRNFYKDRGSGKVGVNEEYKRSSTVKIGDTRGYTEYSIEEKVRNFSFGNQTYDDRSSTQLPSENEDYDSNVPAFDKGVDFDIPAYNKYYDSVDNDEHQSNDCDSDVCDEPQSNGCDPDGSNNDDDQSYSNADDHGSYTDQGQSNSNGCDDDGGYFCDDDAGSYFSDGGQSCSYSYGGDDDGSYYDD